MKVQHAYLKAVSFLFALALVACTAKTHGPMGQTTSQTPSPPASQIVSPRDNTWNTSIAPVPAPSSKPKYRLNEITFSEGTTVFGREGNGVCRDAALMMQSRGVKRVLLVGHTHKGEKQNLGLDRAAKVRDCLAGHGLPQGLFELSSYGSVFSKADVTEPTMMEQERRVEIWVISES